MSRHVVLLRGINVGGKNKLPMAELRPLCEALGATDVATYIQSGNVVLSGTAAWARGFPDRLHAAIAERHGYDIPIVMLTRSELDTIVRGNPFLDDAPEPKSLHVYFLSSKVSAAKAKRLDPDRSPGDRFAVVGRAVYLHLPNGMGRTKLGNAWFERHLEVIATARNWRTTKTLLELLG